MKTDVCPITPEERFVDNYTVYMGFYRHLGEEGHKKALEKAAGDVSGIKYRLLNSLPSVGAHSQDRERTRRS